MGDSYSYVYANIFLHLPLIKIHFIPTMWTLPFSRHFARSHSNKFIARGVVSSCLTKDQPIENGHFDLVLEKYYSKITGLTFCFKVVERAAYGYLPTSMQMQKHKENTNRSSDLLRQQNQIWRKTTLPQLPRYTWLGTELSLETTTFKIYILKACYLSLEMPSFLTRASH